MLTYSNQSIFPTVREGPGVLLYNVNNISDPTSFNQLLGTTLTNLVPKAASGQLGGKKFAVAKINFIATMQTLYTLAQCTPDLTTDDCTRCLQVAFGRLLLGRQGARYLLPSCNIRYETYSFYNETAVSLLSPPPAPAPSPKVVAPPPPTLVARPSGNELGISSMII